MKERIKLLRNTLGLSQIEFAKKLGYTYASVQNWEKGRSISESSFKLIEKTYSVNPTWLREGVGEMFINDGREESPLANDIIKKIGKLDNENLLRLAGYIDSLQPLDKSDKKSRGGE